MNQSARKKWLVWGVVAGTIVVLVVGGMALYRLLSTTPGTDGPVVTGGGGFFSQLFGTSEDTPRIPVEETPGGQLEEVARLRQLTDKPVAGFGTKPTEAGVVVRYLDRESGNVFEVPAAGGEETRLTNATIPRVGEAVFSATSSTAYPRLLRESVIDTLRVWLDGGVQSPAFLEPNAVAFVASPTEEKIFYLLKTANGSEGYVADGNGGKQRLVFSSPLAALTANWNAPDQITITSKAANGYEGIAYALHPTTGAVRQLINGPGLTLKASAGKDYQLYSLFTESSGQTLLREEKSGESRLAPFVTFPEKCAWSPNSPIFYCAVPYQGDEGRIPDDWYMGRLATADNLWAVDAGNNVAFVLYDLSSRNFPAFDIDQMMVTPDNQYIVFREKAGQTLWSFTIIPELATSSPTQ